MKEWLILISIDMWQYHKSTFLCTHQRLRSVCGKLRCRVSSRWWSTARSVRILTRQGEILYFSNFKSGNGSNMIFFRVYMDPLDHWSVKPHTTCLNFLSILTKQCTIILNTTHWYLNIPLDQTHPFLKGFYYGTIQGYTKRGRM